MSEDFERAYWNQLGITIPPSKPKYYVEYDGESIEVPKSIIDNDERINEVYGLIKSIKSETEFLFMDRRLPYNFKSIEGQYGSVFIRFYVITDLETFKEISNTVLFDGILANYDIHMKCYQTGMKIYNFEKQTFKVKMLGEVEL